jgi:hypothetical protein
MKASTILVAALIAACAPSKSQPTLSKPTPPVATRPPPPPAIVTIRAGGAPGSNTHRWGSRVYELRAAATGGLEFRLHDAIDFQGVNMQPKDMPPTQHSCTSWESVPPNVLSTLPATGRVCRDLGTICSDLESWLRSTRRPVAGSPAGVPAEALGPDTTFGRGMTGC